MKTDKKAIISNTKTCLILWLALQQVFFGLAPPLAYAVERPIKETLEQAVQSDKKGPIATFFKSIDRFLTDEVQEQTRLGTLVPMYGRESEADQTIDTLVRLKGKNPVLVGEAGVGKTAVAELIAQKIFQKRLPSAPAFDPLKKAVVVEVSAASISSLAESTSKNAQQNVMRDFLAGLKEAERVTGRPIIIFMDEMHTLQPAAMQILKTSMESMSGIHFVGATTHGEFQTMVKHDDAMRSRLQSVPVREFTPEETVEVLKQSWVPTLEKKYHVKIDDAAIRAAIRTAPEYDPFGHRPRAPFKVLQDSAILAHRKSGGQAAVLTDKIVGEQVTKALGLTLNPMDRVNFRSQLEKLRQDLRENAVDQERVTDKMVDLWADLNQGTGKSHRVLLVPGPTGAGKTFSAQEFARLALGGNERLLEIDATQFGGGAGSLASNTLIGAPPGSHSAEESSGLLPDFLAGKGKGTNVIVINEFDKADPSFANTIMEMLDTGKVQARDGKSYPLGKSIIILTTNKGDDLIYPRGRAKPLSRKERKARLDKLSEKELRNAFMKPSSTDLNDRSKILPPSVLNRIDAAVPAAPPSHEGAVKIVFQKANSVSKNLHEQYRFKMELTPETAEYLVDTFYSPEDGVRDLNRATERMMSDALKTFEEKHQLGEDEVLKISLARAEESDHPRLLISSSSASHSSIEMAAPLSKKFENPLTNPEAREKLMGLEERLEKHVFGQPEAVKAAAKAVRLRAANLKTKTPAVTMDLGPTGVGKTELGKAVATELFDDPEAYISFEMGEIHDESKLRNFFGSDRGLVGSGTISPFEQFLQRFPDGGVIDFSEIGNSKIKETILKHLYPVLDEGKWTSPLGETYNLSKYMIRFTSNEGQELLNSYPSDDLRMAAWKDVSKRETLVELLKRNRWPEAMIGRLQGNISLYRPSTEESRKRITKKFVDQTIRELQEQHGFKNFQVDEGFYRTMGESFFSHSQGARSIRDAATTELTDLFTEAYFDGLTNKEIKEASFHISLSDNYEGKHIFKGKTPPDRHVMMKLSVDVPGKATQTFSRDLADRAAEIKLSGKREALRIAHHEAGHAVVNDPAETGDFVRHVTIRGKGGYGGYASYEEVPGASRNTTREKAIAKIGRILAGGIAEEKFSPGGRTSGWSSDIAKARELAEKAITDYGLADRSLQLPVKDGKVIIEAPETQKEIRDLVAAGEKYARQRIDENVPAMRTVAARLYKKGHLDETEFAEIIASSPKSSVKAGAIAVAEEGGCVTKGVINRLRLSAELRARKRVVRGGSWSEQ